MKTTSSKQKPRLLWFDALRGLAILWIILYHFTADTGHLTQLILRLSAGWLTSLGDLGHLFAQLGSQGVNMFIVLSGAGLAFAWSHHQRTVGEFYRRHFRRLLIPYYLSMVGLLFVWFVMAILRSQHFGTVLFDEFKHGAWFGGQPFDFSAGQLLNVVFILPRMVIFPATSAWFVALLVQLYLIFPLLIRLLQRLGRWPFLLLALFVSFTTVIILTQTTAAAWGVAPMTFSLVRLVEFGFGLVVGAYLPKLQPQHWWKYLPLAFLVWLIGLPFVSGGIISPFLIAVSTVFMAAPLASALSRLTWLTWVGRRSLEVFLIHDLVRAVYGSWPVMHSWLASWPGGFLVYLAAILLVSYAFTKITDALMKPKMGRGVVVAGLTVSVRVLE